MAELYPWFVVVHLVGLVLFAISHGASAFMAFRLRAERDPVVVDALLKTGQLSVGPMYIGLLLLIVGGLGAAAGANLWGKTWVIASIVVFIVVLVSMWAVASPYYMGLRKSFEERGPDGRPAIEPAALARQLDTRRPDVLALDWNHGTGAARLADGHQARLRPVIASRSRELACVLVRAHSSLPSAVVALVALAAFVAACAPIGADDANRPLENTSWTVNSIAGAPTLPEARPTLTFAADGTVSGTSGCNQYSGAYRRDGGSIHSDDFVDPDGV